jgi:hypothetical protein
MSIEIPSEPRTGAILVDEVDASPLIGTWRNTNAASTQIAFVRIQDVDGRPMVSVWGASRPSFRDWGQVPIGRLYRGSPAAPLAAAFESRFDFGSMTALLEVNISKGLLIVACLKTFRDGSGRSSYFVREFFRKTDDSTPPTLAPADLGGGRPITCADDEPQPRLDRPGSPRLAPALFVGRWKNTDAGTRGLREFRMSDRDGGLLFEINFANGPTDSDRCETVAELFAERADGKIATQFHALIERSGQTLRMHGWVKLGVLVIAIFRHPTDSAASAPWFDREFFYQADRP